MTGRELEELIASFMFGQRSALPYREWPEAFANALRENPDVVLHAMGLRLCGYLCPECHTWAEDMTPHCFNEHADNPVETVPFYVKAAI